MINSYKILFLLTLLIIFSSGSFTQDNEQNQETPFMMLYGEAGYGSRELSFGVGFRWEFISLGLSLSGLGVSNPVAIYPSREIPFPKDFEKFNFPGTTVSVDAGYYYDINEFSIFATVGYYFQSDSVFAKSFDQGSLGTYFKYTEEKKSGLSYSIGGQYFVNEEIGVGLGFHNKKGVFIQLGYYWY